MNEIRKNKLAYILVNFLMEEKYTSCSYLITFAKRFYSYTINIKEIDEIVDYINWQFIRGNKGPLTNEMKAEGLSIDPDGDELNIIKLGYGYCHLYNTYGISYESDGSLYYILEDLKNLINKEGFTNNYKTRKKIEEILYECYEKERDAKDNNEEFDEDAFFKKYSEEVEVEEDELKEEIIAEDEDEEEDGRKYFRNPYGANSLRSSNTNDNDVMRIKRDAWGNLYTEGGRMWDRYMDRDND